MNLNSLRRVVTGHDKAGRSTAVIDETVSNVFSPRAGAAYSVIWSSEGFPVDNDGNEDPSRKAIVTSIDNGTVFLIVGFAPGVACINRPARQHSVFGLNLIKKGRGANFAPDQSCALVYSRRGAHVGERRDRERREAERNASGMGRACGFLLALARIKPKKADRAQHEWQNVPASEEVRREIGRVNAGQNVLRQQDVVEIAMVRA